MNPDLSEYMQRRLLQYRGGCDCYGSNHHCKESDDISPATPYELSVLGVVPEVEAEETAPAMATIEARELRESLGTDWSDNVAKGDMRAWCRVRFSCCGTTRNVKAHAVYASEPRCPRCGAWVDYVSEGDSNGPR